MQTFTLICIRNHVSSRLLNFSQHDCVILTLLFNVIFLHSISMLLKQKRLRPDIVESSE